MTPTKDLIEMSKTVETFSELAMAQRKKIKRLQARIRVLERKLAKRQQLPKKP